MPDKKLTDKEIVKALEICSTYKASCKNCPAFVKVDRSNCKKVLIGAKDLINRLQAENERVRAKCETRTQEKLELGRIYTQKLKTANAEIERLKEENTILSQNADTAFQDGLNKAQELYAEQIKSEIKAEAYKECVEKAKENCEVCEVDGELKVVITETNLNNLLKELVGDA